ncbi:MULTISPECIES: hypothetical protein [unclassified Mesorhizobium]|uniref:hypothetical protein n=1 Tax=unclassified Mesorhizobium TaxID=325217 RepID=UPI00333CA0B4
MSFVKQNTAYEDWMRTAAEIPYASDVLRLAVSVRLADFRIQDHEAATAIFEGYRAGLLDPGPTLLDEREMWMRDYVMVSDQERKSFWEEIDRRPDAEPSEDAGSALLAGFPVGSSIERYARITKGGGSLGRPRFVAVARWRGGRIAREAKALLPSGWDLAVGNAGRANRFDDIVNAPTRAPDPFLHTAHGFIVRRIAPDTRKIERGSDFARRLDTKLLRAMGSEIGSIHASTPRLVEAILDDLERRDADWLQAAKVAASVVEADFANGRRRPAVANRQRGIDLPGNKHRMPFYLEWHMIIFPRPVCSGTVFCSIVRSCGCREGQRS